MPVRDRKYRKGDCGDCGKERKLPAKGLCSPCYNRSRRKADPAYAARCAERSKKWRSENRERVNFLNKRSRDNNPEAQKIRNRRYILKQYGLTEDDYVELCEKQSYRCAVCSVHANDINCSLSVDHNHDTGKVRGLLCRKCNQGIGLLQDSPDILRLALNYLERG